MKRLSNRARAILSGKKGESIVESLASLFVFSFLMLGVTAMVTAALRMTGYSIAEASRRQRVINDMVLEKYEEYDPAFTTTPTLILKDLGGEISVEITVDFFDNGEVIAFSPVR